MEAMSKNVVHIADAWYAAVQWADTHPQKSGKQKRQRWVSADTQPKATGYYVTEDKRGALAVCLWDHNGWHYAWAPVVRWLDMRLEKEK